MKNILLYGGNGYFGSYYINKILREKTFNINVRLDNLLEENFNISGVDAVLYLAAKQQTQKDDPNFNKINTEIPVKLAEICEEHNKQFVYFSTDQVFKSDETKEYREHDVQNSPTKYGISKYECENRIKNKDNVAIIRTSMIYGYKHHNRDNLFSFLRKNCLKQKISLYKDCFVRPTHINDLSNCLNHIIEEKKVGIFHCLSENKISRFDLAKEFYFAQKLEDKADLYLEPECVNNSDLQKNINMLCTESMTHFFNTNLNKGILDEI